MPYATERWSYLRNETAMFWIWLWLTILLIYYSIFLANFTLVYTLDDPYIHLAVANNITQGAYGVNLTEYSSPSSSIIFPFLLASALYLGFGDWGPLVINVIATALTVLLITQIIERNFAAHIGAKTRLLLALCFLFASNSLALPMTGMEHSLHVAACIATLYGLIKLAEGQSAPLPLVTGVIAMPLLRFEGLAMTVGALLTIALLKRYRLALFLAATVIASYLVYAKFVSGHSLPLLPSSVLIKSEVASGLFDSSSLLSALFAHLRYSLHLREGKLLAVMLALLAPKALLFMLGRGKSPEGAVALTASAALSGHLLGGDYGWFARYEVYAVCTGLIAVLYVYRPALGWLASKSRLAAAGALAVAVLNMSTPYIAATLNTPKASRGIYEQQYQMHRFAVDFLNQPIAVNDLGFVAYRNPNFVLDLIGLGSEPVRKAKAAGTFDKEFIRHTAEQRGVVAAMVYEEWFPDGLPVQWVKVGQLETQRVTAAIGKVAFFATHPAHVQEVTEALYKLKATLPGRVKLTIIPARQSIATWQ